MNAKIHVQLAGQGMHVVHCAKPEGSWKLPVQQSLGRKKRAKGKDKAKEAVENKVIVDHWRKT